MYIYQAKLIELTEEKDISFYRQIIIMTSDHQTELFYYFFLLKHTLLDYLFIHKS